MRRIGWILFAISGLVPLLSMLSDPPDPTLLPYSLLVLAVFQRDRVRRWMGRVPGRPALKWLVWGSLCGLLTEFMAWWGNYLARSPNPALFHPQLIPDLLLGVGFYLGALLAMLIAARRWRFTVAQIAIVFGLYGIFVEQDGAILTAMLALLPANPGGSVFLGVYVFAVYAAFAGLAYLPVAPAIQRWTARRSWLQYAAVIVLLALLTRITFFALALVWDALGLIPAPRPIDVAPLF
jgi:hypothetical protein